MDIEFTALSLHLRNRLILNQISGRLTKGQVTVIIGPNGAGKSSLLSCLAALHTPTSGTITLGGKPLASYAPRERARHIGLLPQQADIHWDMHVRALVGLGRLPHHGRWGETDADRAAIIHAMEQTHCTELAERKAQRLSGGEQARVLLARVLAGQPDWILADEPLASLDPAHQLDTMACFRNSADAGAGVVLVLHDLTHAARIADHLLVMKAGEIIASGTKEAVLTPAILAQAYGVYFHISNDDDGAAIITPSHRLA